MIDILYFFQVKVIVNLKGRENDFRNIAIELIRRFQNDVGEVLWTCIYDFYMVEWLIKFRKK